MLQRAEQHRDRERGSERKTSSNANKQKLISPFINQPSGKLNMRSCSQLCLQEICRGSLALCGKQKKGKVNCLETSSCNVEDYNNKKEGKKERKCGNE